MNISFEEYKKVSEKYKPNKFIKWIYKNFSTLLTHNPKPIGSWISLSFFFIATIGIIVFDQLGNKEMANLSVLFYIPFVLWIIISLIAFIMNNNRNKKIAKELGISNDEFNKLVIRYE